MLRFSRFLGRTLADIVQFAGRVPSPSRTLWYASLLLAMSACKSGDGTTAVGPAATVTFSTSALTFTANGASQVITATIADAGGHTIGSAVVTWTSDNTAIAEVQGSGHTATIIAHGKGNTLIHATSGTATATISITVLGVQAIVLSPPNATVRIGTTQAYTAQVTADAGVSQAVNWSTGSVTIATVSTQGVVTPVAVGTTTVQATSVADPSVSATTQLTVAAQKGVVVSPSTATIGTAQTTTLTANVVVDNGQSTAVTWSTSASAVASVSQQGVVTGVALGTATITATSTADNTLKGTALITVAPVIRSVTVNPPTPQLFINQTQQLTAVVTADAGLAQTVSWATSNSAVATVNNGLVTAVSLGTVTITATSTVDATRKGTATVTVAPRPVAVSIAQRNVAISPGSTATLTAIVTADPGVSTAVTWTSSAIGVATVGSTTGVVAAVTQGATLITATSVADQSKQDTVTVNVTPRLATSWAATRLSGPMIEDIVSIFPVSSSAAWAVNDIGDIYKFDGTNWTRTAKGSDFSTVFTAVHGTNASSIIAVGTGGVIVQWNGATWTAMSSGTTQDLIDVWMESPTSAFAVGAGGTARRLTGTTWAATTTGSNARLNGVWTVPGSGVWFAVGNNGELLRFATNAWARVPNSPTTEHLYDVAGVSATDVYAVGAFGTIVHFDGASWQVVASNGVTADLYAIGIPNVGGPKVQIVGDGVALQVNGPLLVDLQPTYAARYMTALADLSGNMWIGGQRGLVMRNLAGTWTTLNMAPDLLDVWTTAPNNSWLVGELGTVFQWNGTTWSRVTVPANVRLNSVWGLGTSLAFVGGDGGLIMRWDGANWVAMSTPTTNDVVSLWGTSASNVYAATYGGEVLRYSGTSWSIVMTQAEPLYSVFGSGASDIYAAGDLGTVKRFDGANWTARNVGNNALLSGIWASGQSDVYTVGVFSDLGVAYRFTSAWQTMSGLSSPTLTSVWGTSPFDLYATGAAGTLLRYNGSSWQPMTSGTTDLLWSVSGAPNGSAGAFAVGANATLVTGSGSSAIAAARLFSRNPGSLATASRVTSPRGPYVALPDGAARRSLRAMHAPSIAGASLRATHVVPPLVKYGASRNH